MAYAGYSIVVEQERQNRLDKLSGSIEVCFSALAYQGKIAGIPQCLQGGREPVMCVKRDGGKTFSPCATKNTGDYAVQERHSSLPDWALIVKPHHVQPYVNILPVSWPVSLADSPKEDTVEYKFLWKPRDYLTWREAPFTCRLKIEEKMRKLTSCRENLLVDKWKNEFSMEEQAAETKTGETGFYLVNYRFSIEAVKAPQQQFQNLNQLVPWFLGWLDRIIGWWISEENGPTVR